MSRIAAIGLLLCVFSKVHADDLPALPIDLAAVTAEFPAAKGRPQSLLSLETVASTVQADPAGFAVKFPDQVTLLDGTVIAGEDIHGSVLTGPWPFASRDSRLRVKRFHRRDADVKADPVSLADFFAPTTTNSEGWSVGSQGRFVLRMELAAAIRQTDEKSGNETTRFKPLGIYDTSLTVRLEQDGTFTRLPTILEGPAIHLVTSDHPDRVVISLVSDVMKAATVTLNNDSDRTITGPIPRKLGTGWYQHEIPIGGLQPKTKYTYRVQVGATQSENVTFCTAPVKGAEKFRFAFLGDSRGGVGNSMTDVAAVNVDTMERLCGVAAREKTDLILFGGDFSTGYTQIEEDFRTQLRVWKQSASGISGFIPFYAVPGNHEALMKTYSDPASKYGLSFDRWPYDRHSTEAVFADEFVNPTDGPQVRPGFPPYSETAYTFQYGCVEFIGFNTNYWLETDTPNNGGLVNQGASKFGGCPEGYVMSEQLKWIQASMATAESDPTVKHIVLFAHEPMFPNGKHTADAMWYHGNNNSRAHVFADGKVQPEPLGVIEVRNTLARLISASPKAVCVINSDEHALYRTLITSNVPAGSEADINPDTGTINWPEKNISPIPGLKHPTWYIVSGGGGAPYSAELKSPWNTYWKTQKDPKRGYYYTPQENILIFDVTADGVSLTVRNAFGEKIDGVKDLVADRH